jgi:hypothetical protein
MNSTTIIPVAPEALKEGLRLAKKARRLNAWRTFGTIGFEAYRSHVLALEARRVA